MAFSHVGLDLRQRWGDEARGARWWGALRAHNTVFFFVFVFVFFFFFFFVRFCLQTHFAFGFRFCVWVLLNNPFCIWVLVFDLGFAQKPIFNLGFDWKPTFNLGFGFGRAATLRTVLCPLFVESLFPVHLGLEDREQKAFATGQVHDGA